MPTNFELPAGLRGLGQLSGGGTVGLPSGLQLFSEQQRLTPQEKLANLEDMKEIAAYLQAQREEDLEAPNINQPGEDNWVESTLEEVENWITGNEDDDTDVDIAFGKPQGIFKGRPEDSDLTAWDEGTNVVNYANWNPDLAVGVRAYDWGRHKGEESTGRNIGEFVYDYVQNRMPPGMVEVAMENPQQIKIEDPESLKDIIDRVDQFIAENYKEAMIQDRLPSGLSQLGRNMGGSSDEIKLPSGLI